MFIAVLRIKLFLQSIIFIVILLLNTAADISNTVSVALAYTALCGCKMNFLAAYACTAVSRSTLNDDIVRPTGNINDAFFSVNIAIDFNISLWLSFDGLFLAVFISNLCLNMIATIVTVYSNCAASTCFCSRCYLAELGTLCFINIQLVDGRIIVIGLQAHAIIVDFTASITYSNIIDFHVEIGVVGNRNLRRPLSLHCTGACECIRGNIDVTAGSNDIRQRDIINSCTLDRNKFFSTLIVPHHFTKSHALELAGNTLQFGLIAKISSRSGVLAILIHELAYLLITLKQGSTVIHSTDNDIIFIDTVGSCYLITQVALANRVITGNLVNTITNSAIQEY